MTGTLLTFELIDGHLHAHERDELRAICRALLDRDERREWDRACIVRKKAEEPLRYC